MVACRGSAPAVPTTATVQAAPLARAGDTVRVPFTVTSPSSMRLDWQVPERAGQLTNAQLVELAPRIARLRAEPDTLRMDVTDSLDIARLVRVLALDDNGVVLGEIRRYAFSFRNSLYPQPSGMVRASRAGIGVFGASIPQQLSGDFRTRGPAQVSVIITDSTGAGARALEIPTGSGVISGVVRDSLGQPLPRAQVLATRRVGMEIVNMTRASADAEGRYRLEGLPAGPLTLRASWRGHQLLSVDAALEEGANVTRDLQLLPLSSASTMPMPRSRPPGDQ
jgi:hypothetical protein